MFCMRSNSGHIVELQKVKLIVELAKKASMLIYKFKVHCCIYLVNVSARLDQIFWVIYTSVENDKDLYVQKIFQLLLYNTFHFALVNIIKSIWKENKDIDIKICIYTLFSRIINYIFINVLRYCFWMLLPMHKPVSILS